MKINVKGPIISNNDQWVYDWFGIEAVSPGKVSGFIDEANQEDLEVEINSGGGSVFDASEIYTMLKDYPSNVTVKIVGLAASAASVIAMAGDKVIMAPTAQMMIHNASTYASGDYRDMDQTSKFLQNTNQTIANAYRIKSGKSDEELLAMMDDETWMTAQQAKEHGLIDEIMFQNASNVAVASVSAGMLPSAVLDKVRNEFQQMTTNTRPSNVQTQAPNPKEEPKTMNLEQLKNDHPQLFEEVKNLGFTEGIAAENKRIQDIENLQMPGNEELVNKAKFESKKTAQDVAVEIIMAEKQRGTNFLSNRQEDAEPMNQFKGGDGTPAKPDATEAEASSIANFFNKGGN